MRKHLKICFITFSYPPFTIDGGGIYAKSLCFELTKLNHEIHIISPGKKEASKNLGEKIFHHTISIPEIPSLKVLTFWLKLRQKYKSLEKKNGPFDVLHGNLVSDLTLTKKDVKIPRIVTIHHLFRTTLKILSPSITELLLNFNGELSFRQWVESKILDSDKIVTTRAHKIIAVSNFTKKSLIDTYKIPEQKISVVYNGVNVKDFEYPYNKALDEYRIKFGQEKNKPLLLFVGRLELRKGLPFLLKAIKILLKSLNLQLVVVGEGKKEPFKKIADTLGISKHVTFIGSVDFKTLRMLYNVCDIFVLPSLLEGFGLTVLEAMAAGKPIVASNTGGIPEIVKNNVNGILVDPRNHSQLAKALSEYLENPELAEEVGRRNKEVTKNFSWTQTAKLTEKVYLELID